MKIILFFQSTTRKSWRQKLDGILRYAKGHDWFVQLVERFATASDVRRTGSAALDLCSVASGCAELFFELSLSPWDYAAGALIVEEAGGVVTDINGNTLSFSGKSSVMARNRIVYPTC